MKKEPKSDKPTEPPKEPSNRGPLNIILLNVVGFGIIIVLGISFLRSDVLEVSRLLSTFQRTDTVKDDRVVNPMKFGAVCDKKHNDTRALNIAAWVSSKLGFPMEMPDNCVAGNIVPGEELFSVRHDKVGDTKVCLSVHHIDDQDVCVDWHLMTTPEPARDNALSECQKRQAKGEKVGCAGYSHYREADPQSDPNLCTKWTTDCHRMGLCDVTCELDDAR